VTYIYPRDGDDDVLTFDSLGSGQVAIDASDGGVTVHADDFPELITALCKEAGRAAPVVLDRPELRGGRYDRSTSLRAVRNGRHVEIFTSGPGIPLTPGEAREYAAAIAELADQAAREPTEAEVHDLTAMIHADGENGSTEAVARAILRRYQLVDRDA
jgi:hypothetical protein